MSDVGKGLVVQTYTIMDSEAVSRRIALIQQKAWAEYPDVIAQASKRLKGVQIENLPAIDLIRRYNTSDVFIYADPPYLQNTRKKHLYKYEMTDADHLEMLKSIRGASRTSDDKWI